MIFLGICSFRLHRISFSGHRASRLVNCDARKMSPTADLDVLNGDLAATVSQLLNFPEAMDKLVFPSRSHLNFPEAMDKLVFPSRSHHSHEHKGVSGIPTDIMDTPKEYIFYMDVPGLCKSDIQVTVEDDNNTLVIKSSGKRKREDGEEEACKYIRLERRPPHKLMRKFRLPENANTSAITAKCENGVLTVVIEKHPPPPKSRTIEVTIA